MRKHLPGLAGLAALGLLLCDCDATSADPVVAVEATTSFHGRVYIDRNANEEYNQNVDTNVPNARVMLVRPGATAVLGEGRTDQSGLVRVQRMPVGRYRVLVDPQVLGDSLEIADDTATVTIVARDSALVPVGLVFKRFSLGEIRRLPAGRMTTLDAVALNGWSTFGDSTIHVVDSGGALRVTRLSSTSVTAGDSVRIVGRVSSRHGQPVLVDANAFLLGKASAVSPHAVTTRTAAAARDGELDAGLVRITDAVITDTVTVAGDLNLHVDDGSGQLTIIMDRDARVTPSAPVTPGAVVDVTGVLIPAESGTSWTLKPRATADFTIRFPAIPISQARAQPIGSRVIVTGVALNGYATFGDQTVHIADQNTAIRVVSARSASIQVGDSARAIGTILMRDGQPTISDATLVGLGATQQRVPRRLTTVVAAHAQQGALDAALVEIEQALVINTQTLASGDMRVTVNDGSGNLDILVVKAANITPNNTIRPGSKIDATGVLAPATEGPRRWWLKPRTSSDLVVDFPTLSIAEARSQQPGMFVAFEGIALNGRATFGDASVHVADPSGSIRMTSLGSMFLFAGDSVRVVAELVIRDGQPVVSNPTVTILGRTTVPPPTGLGTGDASRANDGLLDAALVRIVGATISSTTRVGTRTTVVVDDGSGELEIVIFNSTGISTSGLNEGVKVTVTGVLVPSTEDDVWVLRPRAREDVTIVHD
jgi:DNA/RNA endonuclease YhcR with UshA esterase domain